MWWPAVRRQPRAAGVLRTGGRQGDAAWKCKLQRTHGRCGSLSRTFLSVEAYVRFSCLPSVYAEVAFPGLLSCSLPQDFCGVRTPL